MRAISFIFILNICCWIKIYPEQWHLSGPILKVSFDEHTSTLTVTDSRSGQVWSQIPQDYGYEVKQVYKDEERLRILFKGILNFEAIIELIDEDGVLIKIGGSTYADLKEIKFPFPFETPGDQYELLLTDGEGILLPVKDSIYPIGFHPMYTMSSGLSMPWMGICEREKGSGYMAIIDTPDDAGFYTRRYNSKITFQPVWLPSKGKFGYIRSLRYHFFDRGGYVAQCKKYRKYSWNVNNIPSLSEKQKTIPAINKITGAPQIFLWDNARNKEFIGELKESGIRKAFIFWDPSHLPYPEQDFDKFVREAGYLSGVYELFRDVHLSDTIIYERNGKKREMWLDRYSYPGMYNSIILVQANGKPHYSGFGYDVCPSGILPEIGSLRVEKELEVYPHDSYFIDAYLASGLFECYHPQHPLTRSEYKNAIRLVYNSFTENYSQVLGGEWGADFGIPYIVYAQGMTTLHTMLFYTDTLRRKPGTIYYAGNWEDNERPSIMVGEFTSSPVYRNWALNETLRVPLYQLVYHDAILTTWRWDDANHHMPDLWWKKDLFNMLYGTVPVWSIDKPRWDKYKETFVQSFNRLCPWVESVTYDEMLNHQFLSPDRKVQESQFSSGLRIVVNFGDTPFLFEDKIIEPGNYIISGTRID